MTARLERYRDMVPQHLRMNERMMSELAAEYQEQFEHLQAENSELRDDLQRANDAVCDAEHDESRAWDRVHKVEAENAKLRELVRYIMHQCNDGNPRCDECIGWNDGECVALQRMRALGGDRP